MNAKDLLRIVVPWSKELDHRFTPCSELGITGIKCNRCGLTITRRGLHAESIFESMTYVTNRYPRTFKKQMTLSKGRLNTRSMDNIDFKYLISNLRTCGDVVVTSVTEL